MKKNNADYWIETLNLERHPEGGYYREVYRSKESIQASALPPRFKGKRAFGTSIYYLLRAGEFSAFHRIQSDELYHFYDGGSLAIWILTPQGELELKSLGTITQTVPQHLIPAGSWFAAEVIQGDYVLAGCTVAPGFEFEDFEIARKENLIKEYPAHAALIQRLSIS